MTKLHCSGRGGSSSLKCNACGLLLLLLLMLMAASLLHARRISHRRLIIHVPVKMKTHHHTHTVYRLLNHGGGIKQTVYKLIGYSEHGAGGPSAAAGHGGGHGGGHGSGSGGGGGGHSKQSLGHGEISYEQLGDCESGKLQPAHRDMFYNHYSRHDDTVFPYPYSGGGVGVALGEREGEDEEYDEFIDVNDAWL